MFSVAVAVVPRVAVVPVVEVVPVAFGVVPVPPVVLPVVPVSARNCDCECCDRDAIVLSYSSAASRDYCMLSAVVALMTFKYFVHGSRNVFFFFSSAQMTASILHSDLEKVSSCNTECTPCFFQ